MLSERWKTKIPLSFEMSASTINVELPCGPNKECLDWDFNSVNQQLRFEKEVWPYLFEFKGNRYVRLSCQIYNFLEEYLLFAEEFENLLLLQKK